MEQNEQQYIKGFNRGYTITKYLPDLGASIMKNIGSMNDFIEGFSCGKEEFEREQTKTFLNELDQIRNKSHDKDAYLESDL